MNQDTFNTPQNDFDQGDFDQFDGLDNPDDQNFDEYQPKPKKKSATLTAVLIVAILAGAGAAAYMFYFKPMLATQKQQTDAASGMPDATPLASGGDATLPPGVMAPNDGTIPSSGASDGTMPPADTAAATTSGAPNDGTLDGAVPPPVSAPTTTAEAIAPVTGNSMDNSALPAPIAPSDTAVNPALASDISPGAVDAPARMPTPSNTDMAATDTIRPSLPVATTSNTMAVAPASTDTATAPAALAPVASSTLAGVTSSALDTKVADLEKRLQTLPDAAALAKLTDTLDALTQRLDALDKRTETLATAMQNAPAPRKTAVDSTPAAAAPSLVPTTITPTDSETPKPAPKPKAAVKKTSPKTAASGWVLRSAQPGAAWLSKTGSEEMTRFAVGQTLPGSGKIVAIDQDSASWVVRTDSGITIRP